MNEWIEDQIRTGQSLFERGLIDEETLSIIMISAIKNPPIMGLIEDRR